MKKTLFICALLAFWAQVSAQGIFESNVSTANSIVRVWHEGEDSVLIYNEETPGKGTFLLYTVGDATAQKIDMPNKISVKDFEIYDDDVWFCGEKHDAAYPGGRVGVVGTFHIPSAFDGSGNINYTVLNTPIGGAGYDLYVRGLDRLDLFEHGQYIVLAMTGDNFIYNDLAQTRYTVVSAVFNQSASTWHIDALFNKDSTAVFTDIAALDNIVTAVGTHVDGRGLIAKSFYKSLLLPQNPTVSGLCDDILCDSPIDKAVITHTINDQAAIAQFSEKTSTILHRLDFASGVAVPATPTRITSTPPYTYSTPWGMQEIRFSRQYRAINVLEYGIDPTGITFKTLLWTFHLSPTAWTLAPLQPFTIVRQASMDVNINKRPVTVGMALGSSNLDVHGFHPGSSSITDPLIEPDGCTEYQEIPFYSTTPSVQQFYIDDADVNDIFFNETHQPIVVKINFNQICE